MRKIYRIKLSAQERQDLQAVTRKSRISALKVIKAQALLLADESHLGLGWQDLRIMEAVGIKEATLGRLRQRCCEVGPMLALERQAQIRPSKQRKLTGEGEARLTALACSKAPEGHAKWTLKLLANELVALEVVESISPETVRTTLKKTNSSPG